MTAPRMSSRKRDSEKARVETVPNKKTRRASAPPNRACDPSSTTTLACPYYKRDLVSHLDCRRYNLQRVKDIRQHINRRHEPLDSPPTPPPSLSPKTKNNNKRAVAAAASRASEPVGERRSRSNGTSSGACSSLTSRDSPRYGSAASSRSRSPNCVSCGLTSGSVYYISWAAGLSQSRRRNARRRRKPWWSFLTMSRRAAAAALCGQQSAPSRARVLFGGIPHLPFGLHCRLLMSLWDTFRRMIPWLSLLSLVGPRQCKSRSAHLSLRNCRYILKWTLGKITSSISLRHFEILNFLDGLASGFAGERQRGEIGWNPVNR